MTIKKNFKKATVYICIAFFFIAAAFVCITFTGKSQAGLFEVGSASLLFVIFLHILKKVIPYSSSMIVTILSLLIAIMFLFANFSMQKKRHSEYTFKEYLIGDFLVQRIVGIKKERPDALLAKKLENIIPGEFTQTKTEKFTIESPFEKPEKDLMGDPTFLPLEELDHVFMLKEKFHAFSIPQETLSYEVKFAEIEGFTPGRTRMIMASIEDSFAAMNKQASGNKVSSPLHYPSEEIASMSLLRAVFSQQEKEAEVSVSEMQPVTLEEDIDEEPEIQVMETLLLP